MSDTVAPVADPRHPCHEVPAADRLDFRILGPLELYARGVPVAVAGPRQRTVLAMLLTTPGRVVSVDTLVEAVWNGRPPVSDRTQVAICVASLRKTIRAAGWGEDVVLTVAPGYLLAADAHRIDAREFSAQVERARETAAQGRAERAVQAFGEALALWRGPALLDARSELVRAAAARLDEEWLSAYEQSTALRLELGQHRALIGELTDLVRQPSWEQARAHLMLAHYRCGRRAESLEVFREGRRHCVAELGLEPGPVLSEMHLAILRDEPALIPASSSLTVTGLAGSGVVPAQLPPDESAFTGRDQELSELDSGLLGDRARHRPLRWAQLIGGAGVGKTALAVHWAHRVAGEFPDGQLFADLGGFDHHREPLAAMTVLDDFVRALGCPIGQVPAGPDARVGLYHSLLADRRMLVVLDNVRTFTQVQPLLPGTGTCRVIVTSREPLDGTATLRLRLASLAAPQAAVLLRRAVGDGRVDDRPAATARLGELCDGLPLALRAAAARLAAKPHWTVPDLVSRLEDTGRRLAELDRGGRGVAAGLELSYRSLPPDAAAMFRRLSLLDTTDVPACLGAVLLDTGTAEAEDVLERLVDAHLVDVAGRDAGGRRCFRLHGLRRLYAGQRARTDDGPAERRAVRSRLRGLWSASGAQPDDGGATAAAPTLTARAARPASMAGNGRG